MNEYGSTDQQATGSARGMWRPAGAPGSPYPAPQGPADRPRFTGPQGPVEPFRPPYAGAPYGGAQGGGPQGPAEPYRRPYAPNPGPGPYAGPAEQYRQGYPPHPGPQYAGAPYGPMPNAGSPDAGARQRPGPPRPVAPGGAYPGPGLGPDGGQAGAAAPARPRRRGRVGRWIGAGVVVAALGGVGWYVAFGAPSPVSAAVGDCVSQTGENDVKVVGCGEPSAQFRVAGKVENKTMIAASLFACSDFPDATSSFWQGVQDKPGTVLCLAPLHP